MGSLEPKIANGIRMFKPKLLKEAISFARMRDEKLSHQRKVTHPFNRSITNSPSLANFKGTTPIKRLSWDEMQKRRA